MMVSGLRMIFFLNSPRNLNTNGVRMVLNKSSNKNTIVKGLYATTDDGYNKDIIHKSIALSTVAQSPSNAGMKKPSVLSVLLNMPPIKPIIVLRRQLSPKGQALKKSRKTPLTKPVASPISLPFSIEK